VVLAPPSNQTKAKNVGRSSQGGSLAGAAASKIVSEVSTAHTCFTRRK